MNSVNMALHAALDVSLPLRGVGGRNAGAGTAWGRVRLLPLWVAMLAVTAATAENTQGRRLRQEEADLDALDEYAEAKPEATEEIDSPAPPAPSVAANFWAGVKSLRSFVGKANERVGDEEDLHVGVGQRTSSDDALPSEDQVAAAVAATLEAMDGTLDGGNTTGCTVTAEDGAYTVNRIRTAKLSRNPYPHVYIKDVYPPRVYACMRRYMPGGDDADSLTGIMKRTQKKPRFAIPLRDAKGPFKNTARNTVVKALPNPDFWHAFAWHLGSNKVKEAWLYVFRQTLNKRVGRMRSNKMYYSMDLTRDLTGYNIRPHRDTPNKYVTTLYYLPETADNPFIGTVALKQSGSFKDKTANYQEWKSFSVVKAAAYVPNSAFAFVPCKKSWHGVLEANMTQVKSRDTLQAFVRSDAKLGGLSEC